MVDSIFLQGIRQCLPKQLGKGMFSLFRWIQNLNPFHPHPPFSQKKRKSFFFWENKGMQIPLAISSATFSSSQDLSFRTKNKRLQVLCGETRGGHKRPRSRLCLPKKSFFQLRPWKKLGQRCFFSLGNISAFPEKKRIEKKERCKK